MDELEQPWAYIFKEQLEFKIIQIIRASIIV